MCVHPRALPSTPSERASINGRYPSAWVNRRESSRDLFVGNYRTVIACQLYFRRGENPSPPYCRCVSENPQYPEQSPANGNKSRQKCHSYQLLYSWSKKNEDSCFQAPEASIITISRSQPRHLQLVECLLHTPLQKCLLIIEFLQK